ncbi:MAG: efflux RND transporter permease subunit, partial [Deltaproteobacteria bacterium]|nr:efflux RND transporter permease subunit [Deltaproteobacteria bacterium]
MRLISFFVHRPIATMMILFIFLFFGILSLFKIPIDLFPNVSHPHLSIITKYENSSAEEIEKNITKPLEDELSFLKNLSYLSSVSEEGVSRIQLTFHWGTPMDFAALEAREKIDLVKSKLPEEAEDPIVERYNPNASPILMVNLLGNENQKEEDLRAIADGKLKPTLERILGVAQVKVFGGAEKMIEVALNPHQ